MIHLEPGWRSVDPEAFRVALGHFPTGVVLVTGLDGEAAPVGMVVGSFTSVSLEPPLVAFLPSRSSSTYSKLRSSREIVVNVLAADQEWVCRRFASKAEVDKWKGINASATASGVPVLDDAVVSIHCEVENTVEAGDHDIVISRVVGMRVGSPLLPLLFFQGGYGRFTPSTLVVPSVAKLVEPIRLAELARPGLERLASMFGVECAAAALVEDSIFTLTGVPNPSSPLSPLAIGRRVPFVAPVGAMFVADEGEQAIARWLETLAGGSSDDSLRLEVVEGLNRARLRGYSIVLESKLVDELDRAADALSGRDVTVALEAHYRKVVSVLAREYSSVYEPAMVDGRPIRVVSAPVRAPNGPVALVLQLRNLPEGLSEDDVATRAKYLKAAAAQVERQLRAIQRLTGATVLP